MLHLDFIKNYRKNTRIVKKSGHGHVPCRLSATPSKINARYIFKHFHTKLSTPTTSTNTKNKLENHQTNMAVRLHQTRTIRINFKSLRTWQPCFVTFLIWIFNETLQKKRVFERPSHLSSSTPTPLFIVLSGMSISFQSVTLSIRYQFFFVFFLPNELSILIMFCFYKQ